VGTSIFLFSELGYITKQAGAEQFNPSAIMLIDHLKFSRWLVGETREIGYHTIVVRPQSQHPRFSESGGARP